MPLQAVALYLKLPVFALVAARLAGLLMFQPVLGAIGVPANLRVLLVLGLAALMTPFVSAPAAPPDGALGLTLALGGELLVGAVLGLLTAACFAALQMAGLLVAQQSGLAFGQIVDPTTEEEDTVLGVFYLQFALVVYLAIGGHRALLAACLDTFARVPLLGEWRSLGSSSEVLCQALTLSGQLAFRIAGPTLLTLLLVDLALGFISRTMPQLNVLVVGFSLKSLVAFVVMAISLPAALDAFVAGIEELSRWAGGLLEVV